MLSQASITKKRKRADSTSDHLNVSIYDKSPSAVGPVLATFSTLEPPKSTAFSVYAPPQRPRKDKSTDGSTNTVQAQEEEFSRRSLALSGETDTVEFYATGEAAAAQRGCRYLIGIRNKRTNTLLLRPSPLQILGRRVKALKDLVPLPSTSFSLSEQARATERMEQRAALGETFGTQKAQKALRATQRNRVDVSAMEDVVGHIQESVELGTKSLPTQEEAKEISDASRQIPKFNIDATRPEDVYKLHDIVPSSELRAVPIKDLQNAFPEQRMGCIPGPFRHSEWMKAHLERVFASGEKPSKRTLRILMYIAILLTFRAGAPRYCANRSDLEERLPGVPSIIVDGIYSRFTETVRGSSATKFTSDNAVRLLTHVFALCLRVDNFASDTALLASDLRESVTKVNPHFKLLGCKIEKLSAAEMSRLGLPAMAAEQKRAVLRVPLEFPKARARRRAAA
ncbi:RPA49 [Sanghuangporus sanghuang]